MSQQIKKPTVEELTQQVQILQQQNALQNGALQKMATKLANAEITNSVQQTEMEYLDALVKQLNEQLADASKQEQPEE